MLIFNIESRKEEKIVQNDFSLYATSPGTLTADNTVIGFVQSDYKGGNIKAVKFCPNAEKFET